jgi:multidrug efflux pump subunit AcrB
LLPDGGRPRQVMVNLDPHALQEESLSRARVIGAVRAQDSPTT